MHRTVRSELMLKMRIKEGLTIAGVTIGGFAIAILVAIFAMAVSLLADKVFSDHLWLRRLFAALIVLVLGYFLFLKTRKRQIGRN
jgi:hypothetical protein